MPATSNAILEEFRRAGALLEGHFILSSGLHSPKYLQCALVLQHPPLAARLCADLARKFKGAKVDAVVGPALGAVIVAYELARAMGVRGIFTERQDGRMCLRRGFGLSSGERVVLCEDVVTTGGSLLEVMKIVREAGAEPVAVATLIDRSAGRDPGFGVPLVSLVKLDIPTYEPGARTCPLCREALPAVKPGSRPGAGGKERSP